MSAGLTFDESTAAALEAIYKTPDIVAQRGRVLEALALHPGERVLDVGVGPGLLAYDMARIVGETGRTVGFDASEAMLTMSARRLADLPATELEAGDATALPFDDASFDAVVSTQVYEYVADMDKALAEVARVLGPGGRVVILDTDWDTAIWATDDRARQRRVLDAWEAHLHDPCLPRTLARRLEAAGLRVNRQEAIPLVNIAYHPNCYSTGIMGAIQGFVSGLGGTHAEDAAAWAAELRERGARGEYFFSMNRYLFSAMKNATR